MNKRLKCLNKLGMACLMLLCVGMSYKIVVNARNVVLPYWESVENEVGYWSEPPKVHFTNLSNSFNISTYVNNAVNEWSNAGITSSVTTTPTNAEIRFYGGTRAQLVAIGFYYNSGMAGLTYRDQYSDAAIGNSYREIQEFLRMSASMCSEAETEVYENVALHEYGHALGWWGHTTAASVAATEDVMCPHAVSGNTSLTERDIRHLKQVYDVMN